MSETINKCMKLMTELLSKYWKLKKKFHNSKTPIISLFNFRLNDAVSNGFNS